MAAGDGRDAVYSLNRLAGTLVNGIPQLDFNGACVKWGVIVLGATNATRGIDVLNQIYAFRNGGKNYLLDTPGVLSMLATGKLGLGENEAARLILS